MIESFAVAKETGQKENPLTPTFFRLWEKKSPFIENERLGMLSLLLLSALLLIVRAKDYWGERQTLDIKFKAFFLSKLEIARARQLEMNESHSHRCVFLYLSQLLYKTFICARLCVWKTRATNHGNTLPQSRDNDSVSVCISQMQRTQSKEKKKTLVLFSFTVSEKTRSYTHTHARE